MSDDRSRKLSPDDAGTDDVEAHVHRSANDDASDDVEAHVHKSANADDSDDVEAHVKAPPSVHKS